MTLLAGVLRRDGAPADADLDAMLAATASWSPDGESRFTAGPVGLAIQPLKTGTPACDGEQPQTRGRVTIVAAARIDNRAELAATLDLQAADASGDAALILAAYDRWGEDCCRHLLGDFAFAIWDAARRRLFCARDHFGVQRLHWFSSGRLFAFATEIRALLALDDVPRTVNELYVGAQLLPTFEDTRSTFFAGVFRLGPAQSITVTEGGETERRYWALEPGTEARLRSTEEYASAYLDHFTRAVSRRLPAAGVLAAALSGGLDSSAVACVSRGLVDMKRFPVVHTISARYDIATESDEGAYIEAVTASGAFQPHFVYPDHLAPANGWSDDCFGPDDEPSLNPQLAVHWLLFRETRTIGARVLLDGLGGDGTISHGFGYLAELARRGRFLRLLAESRALQQSYDLPLRDWIWMAGVRPSVPEPALKAARHLLRRPSAHWLRGTPIREDFGRRIGLEAYARESEARVAVPVRDARTENWRNLVTGLNAYSLTAQGHLAAYFGVEPRYPFFDKQLIEFCLSLPGEQRLKDGLSRLIARRALAGILPEAVRWRRGKGMLNHSFNQLMREHGRPAVEALLREPGPIGAYVDLAVLRSTLDRFLATGANPDSYTLFRILTVSGWLSRVQSGVEPAVC